MSQSLELPTELFEALRKAAEANGMTPTEWIASVLPPPPEKERAPMGVWEGLVGVFDSRDPFQNTVPRTPFGDLLATKLEKQGITRPK